MATKPIKYIIADWSGGIVTIISPRDLQEGQFQELVDINNQFPGRITKGLNVKELTPSLDTNGSVYISNANSGAALYNYRAEWTFDTTPVQVATKYWLYIGSVNSGGTSWGAILINQETLAKDKVFDLGWTKYGKTSTTTGATAGQLVDSVLDLSTHCSVGDIIYNTDDGTKATVTEIISANNIALSADIMTSGEDYRIGDIPKPTAYFYAGNIRISDSVLTNQNSSKWIGHINRKMFGVDDPDTDFRNMMSPNAYKPQIALEANSWEIYDQELAPPKIVKMDGCFDPTGKVRDANQVGLFIYEPTTYSHKHTVSGTNIYEADPNPGEHIDWMDAQGGGNVFSSEDKYAFTYIYDGVQESELSRDEKGNIGITGFDCAEVPEETEVEAMKYNPTATSDVADAIPIKVEEVVSANPHDRYGAVQLKLTSTDANFGAHKELSVGEYLEIGSEILLVYKIWYNSGAFVLAHRGCRGTTPIDVEGKTIYRTSAVQKARAINIVVNTGAGAGATTTSPDIDASGSGTLTFTFDKALGAMPNTKMNSNGTGGAGTTEPYGGDDYLAFADANGNTVNVDSDGRLEYNGAWFKWEIDNAGVPAGQDSLRIQKLAFDTEVSGGNNNNMLIHINPQNDTGDTASYKFKYIHDTINQVAPSNASSGDTPKLDHIFEIGRWGQMSYSGGADEDTVISASMGATYTQVTGGTNSPLTEWNRRVTGIKLYWQPKGEEDWYHAMTYDINKGAWDDIYAQRDMKSTFGEQIGDRNVLGETGNQVGANFGAWIDCPYWEAHSGWALKQYGTGAGSSVVDVLRFHKGYLDMGTTRKWQQNSGAISNVSAAFDCEHDEIFGAIQLIAPIDSAYIEAIDNPQFNTQFHKEIGKFNQLRTMYSRYIARATGYVEEAMVYGASYAGKNDRTYVLESTGKLTFSATNNTITISGTTAAGITSDFWQYLGYIPGNYLVIFKQVSDDGESERVFPNDNFGIYRIKYVSIVASTIYVDPDFKAVDHDENDVSNAAVAGLTFPVNHYGGGMWNNKRIIDTQNSKEIGMEAVQDADGTPSSDYNYHGYEYKSAFARGDCATTMYLPFDGAKLMTYQSLTDRSQKARIKPVKWKDSTIINAITVVGNVDIVDDENQRNRERSRILWTLPYRFDEFSFHRSRDIGTADADDIVGITSIQGGVIVMKENNVYILDPTQNFREVQRIQGIGLSYPNAYTITPFGVAILNKSGIYLMPNKEELSMPIRDAFYSSTGLTIANPTLGFSAKLGELIFIPDTTTAHTGYYKYNFAKKGWTQHGKIKDIADGTYSNMLFGDNDEAQILVFDNSDTAHADHDTVSVHEFNADTGATVSTNGSWKTKEYVFDSPDTIKYIRTLRLTYKSSVAITCSIYVDGVLDKTKSIPANTALKPFNLPVNATGKGISFKFETTSTDLHVEDMELIGWDTMKGD